MKHLQKYEKFRILDPDTPYNYNDVKEMIYDFMKANYIMDSFTSGHYFRHSGNEDVGMLRDYLKNKGIILDKFMKDNWDIIIEDDFFISKNGFMDYLLYCYDKKYPLSGNKMYEGDVLTKYNYGYHNYDLGKKYILQNYTALKNYFNKFIETYILSNQVDKNSYFIYDYDNSNVFLFIAPSMSKIDSERLEEDFKMEPIEIGDDIWFFNFGDLDINNEDELADYYDYKEIVKELELKSNVKKYNL
jgi:hypothetical protein